MPPQNYGLDAATTNITLPSAKSPHPLTHPNFASQPIIPKNSRPHEHWSKRKKELCRFFPKQKKWKKQYGITYRTTTTSATTAAHSVAPAAEVRTSVVVVVLFITSASASCVASALDSNADWAEETTTNGRVVDCGKGREGCQQEILNRGWGETRRPAVGARPSFIHTDMLTR